MKQMEEIVANPNDAVIPKALDGLHVLTTWLVHSSSRDDVITASAILLNRLPPEFAVVLAKEMLHVNPSFSKEVGYKTFIKKNASLIAS